MAYQEGTTGESPGGFRFASLVGAMLAAQGGKAVRSAA